MTDTPFPHLRKTSPEVLALVEQLRQGQRLPLDPDPKYSEALRLFAIERGIVEAWAREVQRGAKRQRIPEVAAWSEATRRTWNVQNAWESTT
jgi:hypothetical protein